MTETERKEEEVFAERFERLVQLRVSAETLGGTEQEVEALFQQALADNPEIAEWWKCYCSRPVDRTDHEALAEVAELEELIRKRRM